jgi:glycosyltransferase involved in cell wall biosynthesis
MSIDVSVIIPCYNDGGTLLETIDSALSYKGKLKLEVIVVNDGSKDPQTLSILQDIEKDQVIKVITQENKGLPSARNTGFKAASGQFVIPLDADDLLNPAFVDVAFAKINKDEKIGVVFGDSIYFGTVNKEKVNFWNQRSQFVANGLNALALIRRKCWEKTGGYDESMVLGYEDWEFWINVSSHHYLLEKVDTIQYHYRQREFSLVSETVKKHYEILKYIHTKHHSIFFQNYTDMNRELREIKNDRKLLLKLLFRNLLGKTN